MTCCFLGYKDAPSSIYTARRGNRKIDCWAKHIFLPVRQSRSFWWYGAEGSAKDEKQISPHQLQCGFSLHTRRKDVLQTYEFGETMLPEGIKTVHPRYAISWRNKWMGDESDYVLCYINHVLGGAVQYVDYSKKRSKSVINLASCSLWVFMAHIWTLGVCLFLLGRTTLF